MFLSFSIRLISLGAVPFTSIHVVENGNMSFFFFMAKLYSSVYHTFFIRSSIFGQLGRFHTLAIVHRAAMNMVHTSFQISVFIFFREILRSGIVGSTVSFVRDFQYAVCPSGCTNLYSCQQCLRIPFFYILTNTCFWSF